MIGIDIGQIQFSDSSDRNPVHGIGEDTADGARNQAGLQIGRADIVGNTHFQNQQYPVAKDHTQKPSCQNAQCRQDEGIPRDKGFGLLQGKAVDPHDRQLLCLLLNIHYVLIQHHQHRHQSRKYKADDDDDVHHISQTGIFAVVPERQEAFQRTCLLVQAAHIPFQQEYTGIRFFSKCFFIIFIRCDDLIKGQVMLDHSGNFQLSGISVHAQHFDHGAFLQAEGLRTPNGNQYAVLRQFQNISGFGVFQHHESLQLFLVRGRHHMGSGPLAAFRTAELQLVHNPQVFDSLFFQ